MIKFEWDSEKAKLNIKNHGVGFDIAVDALRASLKSPTNFSLLPPALGDPPPETTDWSFGRATN